MPVSAIRAFDVVRRAECCTVRPECRDWLTSAGVQTASDILALPGVVVSGHVGRNVSRVEIAGTTAYLKREHVARVRDRFRSWRDGFGWASMSAREAAILRRLDDGDLPGPKWLAFGQAGQSAFLLVEGVEGATDLRSSGRVGLSSAGRLGRAIARIHDAGIDQPDLFAKHFLVQPEAGSLTILDWQRAVVRTTVSWPRRIRGLAALKATAGDDVLPPPVWTRLLTAYRAEANKLGAAAPDPGTLRAQVEARSRSLAQRPGVRSQRLPAVVQELVRIEGETVCAIPAVATELAAPNSIVRLYDLANHGGTIAVNGRTAVLHVCRRHLPFARWLAALRGRAWRSAELRVARLLFHLERHGIPAPRLLAYGQRSSRFGPAESFVLFEAPTSRCIQAADRERVCELLDRVHTAGCRLSHPGTNGEPFGIGDLGPAITDPWYLRLTRRVSRRQARRDRDLLDAFFAGAR
jgi:hypothetical protein